MTSQTSTPRPATLSDARQGSVLVFSSFGTGAGFSLTYRKGAWYMTPTVAGLETVRISYNQACDWMRGGGRSITVRPAGWVEPVPPTEADIADLAAKQVEAVTDRAVPQHTTPAIALAHLENHQPATPAMAVIQAVREGDDTPLDACSLVAALRVALHALDMVAEVEGRNAFEDLVAADQALGGWEAEYTCPDCHTSTENGKRCLGCLQAHNQRTGWGVINPERSHQERALESSMSTR